MAFLSAEPQSRVVLESHSNRLLAQFDTQLGIVTNRYLAFFQERSVNLVQQFKPYSYTKYHIVRRSIERT